jgi:hypothetical protein
MDYKKGKSKRRRKKQKQIQLSKKKKKKPIAARLRGTQKYGNYFLAVLSGTQRGQSPLIGLTLKKEF